MKTEIMKNKELGLSLHFWNSSKKKERVFLATEIMKQLGYSGGVDALKNCELESDVDFIKLFKKNNPIFFKQLIDFKSIGARSGSVIMLYESGVWKLIMKSKKQIGIKTRNWLAREVLPSISRTGKYDLSEFENNPFSLLHEFTEPTKQIQNSKNVATKVMNNDRSYSVVFNEIHKLVVGCTAKEIKEHFQSKESARQLLRKHLPHLASTEAFIDELYTKYNKSLEEIEKSDAHKTLPPAFNSLFKLGIKIID